MLWILECSRLLIAVKFNEALDSTYAFAQANNNNEARNNIYCSSFRLQYDESAAR